MLYFNLPWHYIEEEVTPWLFLRLRPARDEITVKEIYRIFKNEQKRDPLKRLAHFLLIKVVRGNKS